VSFSWVRRPWVGAVVALLVVGALVFVLGAGWQERREELGGWQQGTASVGERTGTVELDDWSYGIDESVSGWIDGRGSWHQGGWPRCLGRLRQVSVRFQAREVTVDGVTWRPVVAVDCRGTYVLDDWAD
jgi:hypothetical protein